MMRHARWHACRSAHLYTTVVLSNIKHCITTSTAAYPSIHRPDSTISARRARTASRRARAPAVIVSLGSTALTAYLKLPTSSSFPSFCRSILDCLFAISLSIDLPLSTRPSGFKTSTPDLPQRAFVHPHIRPSSVLRLAPNTLDGPGQASCLSLHVAAFKARYKHPAGPGLFSHLFGHAMRCVPFRRLSFPTLSQRVSIASLPSD